MLLAYKTEPINTFLNTTTKQVETYHSATPNPNNFVYNTFDYLNRFEALVNKPKSAIETGYMMGVYTGPEGVVYGGIIGWMYADAVEQIQDTIGKKFLGSGWHYVDWML